MHPEIAVVLGPGGPVGTAWLAGLFILTSISLTVLMQHQTTHRHSVLSTSSQSTPKSK